jgi:hypothetical protein
VKNSGTNYDTSWAAAGSDLNYDGDYTSGPTYKDGEIVVYNGVAYMCVVPTSSPPTAWPGAPPVAQPAPYIVGRGTTLPASPYDGQEYVLVDSLTNPTYQWRFRYAAGSTSAYKWEFVGGIPATTVPGGTFTSDGSWRAFTTGSITIPRTGEYLVDGGYSSSFTAAGIAYVGFGKSATIQLNTGGTSLTVTSSTANVRFSAPTVSPFTAGDLATLMYWSTGGTASIVSSSLTVVPKRVS